MSNALFKKVLIANRGEVALRVIRACHELGIPTVAIHSSADSEALHVKLSTESVCIGPASPTESYLNIPTIIAAAEATGSQAIHPGYGFLSENSYFAEICTNCGITFIGPTVQNMRQMGDKASARKIAIQNSVPVIPGSPNAGTDATVALKEAEKLGFPVLIKATAGGGGRGMKIVENPSDFVRLFEQCKREVQIAFGDPNVYVEKYVKNPRHVEIQIIGDRVGNVIHLGERDCSTQRRYQKLIEESPAFGLRPETVQSIRSCAVVLAKAINYGSVGTLEFLVDPSTEQFYFIEMNTRLQVEHPVTEMVSLVDVVKEQIRIAAGEELSYRQSDIEIRGHAIEARINAEDPVTFRPSPGKITGFHPPGGPGIRVDSALYDNYTIPPFYDSLAAKIIAWSRTREESINKLLVALNECLIDGIKTNIPLHQKILMDSRFRSGKVHTKLLEEIIG